jgi:hypothetical protein
MIPAAHNAQRIYHQAGDMNVESGAIERNHRIVTVLDRSRRWLDRWSLESLNPRNPAGPDYPATAVRRSA